MREFIHTDNDSEQTEHTKHSNLPIININIQNLDLKALIDTGAEISLINEDIINKYKNNFQQKQIKISKIKLVNANGKKFAESSRVLHSSFIVQQENFDGEFVVIPSMNFDIIIGEDILSKLRAKIDFEERTLQLDGRTIPIININDCDGKRADLHMMETPTYEINNINMPQELIVNCPPRYNNIIQQLLYDYNSLINFEPRIAVGYIHKLNVDETKLFRFKSYPVPFKYREKVQFEISTRYCRKKRMIRLSYV